MRPRTVHPLLVPSPVDFYRLLACLAKMLGFLRNAVNCYEIHFTVGKPLKVHGFLIGCETTMGLFAEPN